MVKVCPYIFSLDHATSHKPSMECSFRLSKTSSSLSEQELIGNAANIITNKTNILIKLFISLNFKLWREGTISHEKPPIQSGQTVKTKKEEDKNYPMRLLGQNNINNAKQTATADSTINRPPQSKRNCSHLVSSRSTGTGTLTLSVRLI